MSDAPIAGRPAADGQGSCLRDRPRAGRSTSVRRALRHGRPVRPARRTRRGGRGDAAVAAIVEGDRVVPAVHLARARPPRAAGARGVVRESDAARARLATRDLGWPGAGRAAERAPGRGGGPVLRLHADGARRRRLEGPERRRVRTAGRCSRAGSAADRAAAYPGYREGGGDDRTAEQLSPERLGQLHRGAAGAAPSRPLTGVETPVQASPTCDDEGSGGRARAGRQGGGSVRDGGGGRRSRRRGGRLRPVPAAGAAGRAAAGWARSTARTTPPQADRRAQAAAAHLAADPVPGPVPARVRGRRAAARAAHHPDPRLRRDRRPAVHRHAPRRGRRPRRGPRRHGPLPPDRAVA